VVIDELTSGTSPPLPVGRTATAGFPRRSRGSPTEFNTQAVVPNIRRILQGIAGITTGDVAAACFSDMTFDWSRSGLHQRTPMVRSVLPREQWHRLYFESALKTCYASSAVIPWRAKLFPVAP
jgi:hypothetical protein